MKNLLLLFTLLFSFSSCKKTGVPEPVRNRPDIVYKLVNKTVRASDRDPMILDVNEDGRIDYLYFAQYLANSSGVHLNVGVNPIGNSLTKMSAPNDDNFQNMGDAASIVAGSAISNNILPGKLWSGDFAYLLIRHQDNDGNLISYEGDWNDGKPHFMPLKLSVGESYFYGWARLSFDRNTEVLTLIDYAWNKKADQDILAGEQ